jgi:hypothetical protein
MHQKCGRGDYDAGCAYQQAGDPKKPISSEQRYGANNQSSFEQNLA